MSETEAAATTDEAGIKAKVLRQVEYYFSDDSFPFDEYLKGQQDAEGYVPLAVICAFKKMLSYTKDEAVVAAALGDSDAIELDADGKRIKRIHPTPDADPDAARTCHVAGFAVAPDAPGVEKNIKAALEKFGKVETVRALRNLSQDGRLLDGSAFAVFEDAAGVEAAVECNGCVIGGRKIAIAGMADWFERLQKKRASMKKKREKQEDAKANPPPPPPKKEVVLGCVLKFEGLNKVEGASREDLKELCGDGVSYVEYERGLDEGYVRLDGPRAAAVAEKIAPAGEATIRDVKCACTVLGGDAEQEYWKRLAEAAANSRKRQGGGRRGGYRGKKQRKG